MKLLEMIGQMWTPRLERCGVVLQDGSLHELPNIHPDPRNGFEMDYTQVAEANPVATWHTHPTTGANLSIPDYHLYLQHPNLWHYIAGAPDDVRCYYVEDGVVLQHDNDQFDGIPSGPLPGGD